MQARSETAIKNDLAEAEDLNVSNLLVTKSERAPATESPSLEQEKLGAHIAKTAALGLLGCLAVTAAILAGWRLLLKFRWLVER